MSLSAYLFAITVLTLRGILRVKDFRDMWTETWDEIRDLQATPAEDYSLGHHCRQWIFLFWLLFLVTVLVLAVFLLILGVGLLFQ